jgi:ubiquinone/menaquinone biosynthesis C-methylase UbiE
MPTEPRRPSPERYLEAIGGYQRTWAMKAALELDVFTAIGEGASDLERIAKTVGAAPRGVRALVNYLVGLGFLTKTDETYALTPDSAAFLDRRSPTFLGDTALFYASPFLLSGFAHTTQAVRRGGSDPSTIDSMAPGHPIWLEYARGMAPLFAAPADSLADLVLAEGPTPKRVLDIAAGHGLFGIAIGRKAPQALVTALDWPPVLALARDHARIAGISDRYHTQDGNAFEVPLGHGWDLVILANFLHHFDPPTCVRLLGRVHAALAERGRVVILEFIPNDDRVTPPQVAQFGLSMLTTTPRGDVYTFDELSAMLRDAGFADPRLHSIKHTPQRAVLALRGASKKSGL